MIHLTGSGFLAQTMAACLDAPEKATWLTLVLIVYPITLRPSAAQAADFWGRKWIILGETMLYCIGCITVARSNSNWAPIEAETQFEDFLSLYRSL